MPEKFIRDFENSVWNTIKEYKLLTKKDKVLVACSGGKDSMSTLNIIHKLGYHTEGLIIDLEMGSWSDRNLENTRKFCESRGITLHTVTTRDVFGMGMCYIKSALAKQGLTSCTVCGVIKRWLLNKKARELGATKIATGHNLDDEAQTCVMNLINGNPKLGINMGPLTGLVNDPRFVQRIKPLFFTLEKDSRKYSELMGFPVLYERCPCAVDGQRWKLRDTLDELESESPGTKRQIVESTLSVFSEIRKSASRGQVRACSKCGEPSRSETCKTCQVLSGMC